MTKQIKTVSLVYGKSDYPPMGVLYVANALEQAGFEVQLHESSEGDGNFLTRIRKAEPLFVGFSVHTWPSIVDMVSKSKLLKLFSDIPVVWGGIHPSSLPEATLSEAYVDYIITGDGEKASLDLANAIAEGAPPADRHIVGGVLRELDEYRPSFGHLRLSEYLFASNHSVRGNSKGRSRTERIFYYLMTSRGCPYSCTFCYNSLKPKIPWRAHSADWIIEELAMLKRLLNIDGVGFWDDYFLGDMERSEKVFSFMKKERMSFLCEVRAKDLTEDFAKYLKDAGCMQVFVGAESGSDRMLEKLRKKSTVEHILKAAAVSDKVGLPVRMSFIYGFPNENIEDILSTKRILKECNNHPLVSISGPKLLSVYPGTAIYQEALAAGFEPPATTEDWAQISRSSDLRFLPWLLEMLKSSGVSLASLYEID